MLGGNCGVLHPEKKEAALSSGVTALKTKLTFSPTSYLSKGPPESKKLKDFSLALNTRSGYFCHMVSGIHIRVLLSLGAPGLDSLYLGIVVVTKSFLCLVKGHRLSELPIAL